MADLDHSRHRPPDRGPASLELNKRRTAAVSHGVGVTLPVFVARAGGGIVEDVDGNRADRPRVGHCRHQDLSAIRPGCRRGGAPAGRRVRPSTPSFMVMLYEQTVAVAEELNRITPGRLVVSARCCSTPERRPVEELNPGGPLPHRQARREPFSIHATIPAAPTWRWCSTAKSMPYKSGLRVHSRRRSTGRRGPILIGTV